MYTQQVSYFAVGVMLHKMCWACYTVHAMLCLLCCARSAVHALLCKLCCAELVTNPAGPMQDLQQSADVTIGTAQCARSSHVHVSPKAFLFCYLT